MEDQPHGANGDNMFHGVRQRRMLLLGHDAETDEKTEKTESRLQVAVPIMMPCPRRGSTTGDFDSLAKEDEKDEKDEKDVEDVPSERLVYSIGLFEVPWRKLASRDG